MEAAVDAYVAAWNAPDHQSRGDLLVQALAQDATFQGPTGTFRGRDAVAGLIVALRGRMGDATVTRTGPMAPAGEGFRFGWRVHRSDGSTLMEGTDEVSPTPDGQLQVISVVL